MEKLLIIGSGPAGFTAAIYAARANLSPTVLAGALPGGLLTQTSEVENFPGFPDGVNGFELVYSMQRQAEKFGARVEMENVTGLAPVAGGFEATTESGVKFQARAVIVATGANPRWLGIPSEEKLKNHGVSACATCDGAFYKGREVAVVGGGDSAMEEALFLTNFAAKVTVIHRRDALRASKIMAERALKHPKIEFAWNSEVKEILGEEKVTGVKLYNNRTGAVSTLDCDGVFVAMGHVPATAPFKGLLELDEKGFVKTQHPRTLTGVPGVFAAGDCADPIYRQAITAAASGARAAMDAEAYLSE